MDKRAGNESGFTLLELIITLTIIAILAAGTVPVARNMIKRNKEIELRRNLREIRRAIDSYKADCSKSGCPTGSITNGGAPPQQGGGGPIGPLDCPPPENFCYPEDLEVLVEGVIPPTSPTGKIRWLRRVPKDPFTGEADWGTRSVDDEPTSTSGGSNGVFDVFSKSTEKALDGKTSYKDW